MSDAVREAARALLDAMDDAVLYADDSTDAHYDSGWRVEEKAAALRAALALDRPDKGGGDASERVHSAYREWLDAEDALVRKVMEADAGFDFYDAWSDHYDNSVEFHAMDGYVPSASLLGALWAFGFDRAWFNYSDGLERYYFKDGDPAGSAQTLPTERRRVHDSEPRNPSMRELARAPRTTGNAGAAP